MQSGGVQPGSSTTETHLQKIIMILEVLAQEKLKIRLLIMDLNRQFLMFMYVSRMGHIMVRL